MTMRRRLNFARIHARGDALAWATIDRRVPASGPMGLGATGRAANFTQLEEVLRRGTEYGYAFSEFLDEFYCFRRAEIFAEPPSDYFNLKQRAFFAALAEYMSIRLHLAVPDWVHASEFTLAEVWDREATRADADPVFLRHGIVYNVRNLIRL
jgi:hypothetical protein